MADCKSIYDEQWHYFGEHGTVGPISTASMLTSTTFSPDTLVWNGEDVKDWTPIKDVSQLLNIVAIREFEQTNPTSFGGGDRPQKTPARKSKRRTAANSRQRFRDNFKEFRGFDLPVPDKVTGKTLRDLTKNSVARSADFKEAKDADNPRCHRIPNQVLVDCYNSIDDKRIKQDILAFNYAKDNVMIQKREINNEHSRMEKRFLKGTANATDQQRKGSSMKTAVMNLLNYDDYADKTVAHMLKTLMKTSDSYRDWVADFDKRRVPSKIVKSVIDSARSKQKQYTSKTKIKGDTAKKSSAGIDRTPILKKDGTLDKRYSKQNRGFTNNGTLDKRYSNQNKSNKPKSSPSSSSKRSSSGMQVLRKDGQPDMRYKANRTSSSSRTTSSSGRSSYTSSRSSYSSGPLTKSGRPDMRYKANW